MDAKIPVNNLLSTRGRQVAFLIAWEFEVEEGRGIPGELPSLFPRSPESPPHPPSPRFIFLRKPVTGLLFQGQKTNRIS